MKLFLYILLGSTLLLACKKDNNTDSSSPVHVEGKTKLQLTAIHHSWSVPNIRVFIKKNTLDFPGTDTTLYDKATTADKNGVAVFEHLFLGDYFIYATGYDPIWRGNVYGKLPVTLNTSTVTNNEAYFTLQVNE